MLVCLRGLVYNVKITEQGGWMTKNQKKALRFAYDVLRGRYAENRPLYIYPSVPLDFRHSPDYHWIEPDQDPDRPYLNEGVFSDLVVRGYMEVLLLIPGRRWVYRLSPEGCTTLGKEWPLYSDKLRSLSRRASNRVTQLKRPNDPHRFTRPKPRSDPHRFRRSNDWRRC